MSQFNADINAMSRGRPFTKGHKLAPGGARQGAGRPPEWLKERCREAGPQVIEFLIEVSTGGPMEQVVNAAGETIGVPAAVKDRIKAAEIVLNRGYGMPNQPISNADESNLNLIPTQAVSELAHVIRQRITGGSGK